MADELDHKDIDDLVDHAVEPIRCELPEYRDWQSNWCVDIDERELDRELIDRLEDGGWTIASDSPIVDADGEIYSMIRWAPTEENERMLEWDKRENDLLNSPIARDVEAEEEWRIHNTNDIGMDEHHSRPL